MYKLLTSESCDEELSDKSLHIDEGSSEHFTIFETLPIVSHSVLPECTQLPLQTLKS